MRETFGIDNVVARIYDQEIGLARAGEVVTGFGAGLAARALFQQLSKLGGPPGWALSASVAGAATIAIGYATMRWFETGRKPSSAEMRQVAREVQGRLVGALNPLGWKRPGRKALKQELGRRMKAVTGELEEDLPAELPKAGDQAPEA